jgi:hypothetical protein
MKRVRELWLAAALLAAGCGQYGYRYKPASQNFLNPIFADYRVTGDRVDILVDTHGRRLQKISILSPQGIETDPTSVDFPQFSGDLIGGTGAGWQDPRYTAPMAQGPTIAHFSKSSVGEGPWNVTMDIYAVGHVEILVGGK